MRSKHATPADTQPEIATRKLTSWSLWTARVSAEMITNHVPIVYPVTFLPV
jgi:hypothetical protein